MSECKEEECILSLIYPNTNANIACDEECYLTYCGKKKIDELTKQKLCKTQ